MIALLRKDFMCLFSKNSSNLCKSRVYISLHQVDFYSTSSEEKTLNPEVYDFLHHKHHFSPKVASKAASILTCFRNPEKSDSILSYLKENGFSNTHLEKMLTYRPTFLTANLEKSIMPKIQIFQGMGISNNDIADMITSNASILHRSMNKQIIPALLVLRRVLGSDSEVERLLMRSAWFVGSDLEKSMVPNIEFFKSRSVSINQIISCMHSFPRFFLQKPERVRMHADKAEALGVNPSSSRMYIHAVRVIGSLSDEAWERKLQALRLLGFSEDDILNTIRKFPTCLCVSTKKMKRIKELLVSTGKYDVPCIVAYPMTLMFSIETRYKPRLKVLAALERKNLIEKWPSVGTLIVLSNENFFKKFVSPYPDDVVSLFKSLTATSGRAKGKLQSSS